MSKLCLNRRSHATETRTVLMKIKDQRYVLIDFRSVDLTGFLTIKYILCLFTTRERKERHYIKTITAENIINNIVIP